MMDCLVKGYYLSFLVDDESQSVPHPGLKRSITAPVMLPQTDGWLDDEEINKASGLIKSRKPEINGFLDVTVVALGRDIQLKDPFIQIMHIDGQHWITVSTIGCAKNSVKVYDSMYRRISRSTVNSWFLIMSLDPKSQIIVEMPAFQKQRNKKDCGIFCVAAALSLALGKDPSNDRYDLLKLRSHFYGCLRSGHLSEFPEYPGDVQRLSYKKFIVYICCVCQHAGIEHEEGMWICDGCGLPCHPSRDNQSSHCSYLRASIKLCQSCASKVM